MRRFITAEQTLHSTDRYVDYWLACEFLTAQTKKVGGLHSRIATAIAPHFGRKSKKGTELIKNAFGLKDLYNLRTEILHHGVEEVPDSSLTKIRDLARELIRLEFGLPPMEKSSLSEMLVRSENAKGQ